jgi:hypothetical protein
LDWLHERIILKQWNEHFLLVMRIRGICFIWRQMRERIT